MEKREYENAFPDFDSDVNYNESLLNLSFKERLQSSVEYLLKDMESGNRETNDPTDYSIYTGTTGRALLYYLLATMKNDKSYLTTAVNIVENSVVMLDGKNYSFIIGDSGPLALGVVLYHKLANQQRASDLTNELKCLISYVIDPENEISNDLIDGRAGYLYALMFVNSHVGREVIESNMIRQVLQVILESGQSMSAKQKCKDSPLLYMWNGKRNLGVGHGISGILCMALQARQYMSQGELLNIIRPAVDSVLNSRSSSGSIPLSSAQDSDDFVQWCNGSAGAVHLFALAHLTFGDPKYLEAAEECADLVWRKGLLKKGYGLCHGVSGNTYSFLALYQITKDNKYLHRACKFAEWCIGYDRRRSRSPDHPLSLFEGVAGAIYLMVDIQEPISAKFPGFSL